MPDLALSAPMPPRARPHMPGLRAGWARWWPYLAILAVTAAIRAPSFGNPILDFDE